MSTACHLVTLCGVKTLRRSQQRASQHDSSTVTQKYHWALSAAIFGLTSLCVLGAMGGRFLLPGT
eukprot:852096-Amphidinium_carterae.1